MTTADPITLTIPAPSGTYSETLTFATQERADIAKVAIDRFTANAEFFLDESDAKKATRFLASDIGADYANRMARLYGLIDG